MPATPEVGTPKLPVSAIVVSSDEGHLLGRCLDSISFVEEILVVDLQSTDDTAAIAASRGCRHRLHPRVPIVEEVHAAVAESVRHDWILLIDPDQTVDPALASELVTRFHELGDASVAVVSVPMRFYFSGRPLEGTIWGGVRDWYLLVRRQGVRFTGAVHHGVAWLQGGRILRVEHFGANLVHHHWSKGWRDLLARHRRYLRAEGEARYAAGERFSPRTLLGEAPRRFWECFVAREGYRDRLLGVALSIFWAWYNVGCLLSLRRFERSLRHLAR